ncbi:MAG TPA: response regulator transcription factor [Opitutaceae bacterium]
MTTSHAKPIRLLLVDDHAVVRLGLRTLFNRTTTIQIVGEASTMHEAVKESVRLAPDVILMDIRLPDGSGVEACREIREVQPHARVLFLTSFSDDDTVLSTVFSGASGYLLKEVDSEALIRAIEAVAKGEAIIDPAVKARVLSRFQAEANQGKLATNEPLSPQEQRVLALVAKGHTNKEIATLLNLSDKTVRNYLHNTFQKLRISRRTEAVAWFTRSL